MTQPAWPFTLVHAPSYALNDVPSPSEINKLQEQVAASADGRVWTDVAAVKSWTYTAISGAPTTLGSRGSMIFDPSLRRWLVFGLAGGEVCVISSVGGLKWTSPTFVSGSPLLTGHGAAWANAAGVILAGGTPASSTALKLRKSTDGGSTWSSVGIGAADTVGVQSLVYSEGLGLWICAVGDTTHDGTYTSPDASTWTLRLANLEPTFFTVRESPSPVILGTNLVGFAGSGYRRSVDGITWTSETFPEAISGQQPCWSDALGAFFMSGATGIWKSSTGLTGSWTQVYAGTEQASLGAFGRLLMRGDGKASVDGGLSWFIVSDVTNPDLLVSVGRFNAGMLRPSSREIWLSTGVGF